MKQKLMTFYQATNLAFFSAACVTHSHLFLIYSNWGGVFLTNEHCTKNSAFPWEFLHFCVLKLVGETYLQPKTLLQLY